MPASDSLRNQIAGYNMKILEHYTLLAEMFRYPSAIQKDYINAWHRLILSYDAGLLQKLYPFILHIQGNKLAVQEEYYISTFDVQAVCFLDIGYVLFGEDHHRGIFLSHIKREQEKAGNDCGRELPDHLPNMLTLLPKVTDPELAEELIYSVLIPAVNEMIISFGPGENVYKGLLEILSGIMKMDYPVSGFEQFTSNRKTMSKAG